jgi:predicted O-methyltransferase YrrM
MNAALVDVADAARGWLFPDEGPALYDAAMSIPAGPIVEIGSYCGKSTVYLGAAARELGTVMFAVDHHRGSPEMQPGQENHDRAVVDPEVGVHDTLTHFRHTILEAGLEAHVVAVVGESTAVAAFWRTPVGMVFIDATHYYLPVRADFVAWARWLMPGGVLAFHDVTIPDIDRVALEAIEHGFVLERQVDTLRILRRPV